MPHILIATGGSGGHVFPALALAEEIERRWPHAVVRLTTTGRDIERQICALAGRRSTVLSLLPSSEARRHPFRFATSWRGARREAAALIREFQPACVIGTGGFSMAPVVSAALGQRVPVVLLEQNAVPGRATRWFSKRAAAVCSSFADMRPALGPAVQVIHTGNPVRTGIAALSESMRDLSGPVLVLGGSQGAKGVNDAMAWIAEHRSELLRERGVMHQTGGEESAACAIAAYQSAGIPGTAAPFFSEMATLYARAGLVIARAGATTLAEVACAGLPAILVPYPFARDAHQQANAAVFERAGAAIVVPQEDAGAATGRQLSQVLDDLARNEASVEMMAAKMKKCARPGAGSRVVEVIAGLVGPKGEGEANATSRQP